MYKSLCVAVVLLAAVAITSKGQSVEADPVMPHHSVIVSRDKLTNQNAAIPTTTIYTPEEDGLYRLSVCATTSKADLTSGAVWLFDLAWTDDGGNKSLGGNGAEPLWVSYSVSFDSAVTRLFEAKAGTPINYTVTQSGIGPAGQATYSLYYTLERLE